jgi:outer membrane immunogenic protein
MKRILIAAAFGALACFSLSAQAADPLDPGYDWTGVYLGGSAGIGWSNDDWTYVVGPASLADSNDFAWGAALGAQWQSDSMVWGLEGGLIGNVGGAPGVCPNPAFACDIDETNVVYVGPKFGYAVDNVLFSAMGGYAGGKVETSTPAIATGVPFDTSSEWHNGWFVGAAVDYGWTENVIVGVNYKHIDLGSESHSPSPFNATEVREVDVTADVISATLTLKFNPF